jgi:hypothetical protein
LLTRTVGNAIILLSVNGKWENDAAMVEPKKNVENADNPPGVRVFLPTALGLMVMGWGSLLYLFFYTLPTLGMRWLFFFFAVLAITGTFMPLIAFLHQRFPGKPPATARVIVRESLWIGAYFPSLAWLQIARVLTIGLAVFIALCMIGIEWALRLREKSQWNPQVKEEE